MRQLLIAFVLAGIPLTAAADENGISISHVWSRTAMVGHTGVIYLTVADVGLPDKLVGASTPLAAKAELHESKVDHGIMQMRSVPALAVAPGRPLSLSPRGYHIMLIDLKQPLTLGGTFPVTLHFARAGDITATAIVQTPGAGTAMRDSVVDHMQMPGGAQGRATPGMPGMSMDGPGAGTKE